MNKLLALPSPPSQPQSNPAVVLRHKSFCTSQYFSRPDEESFWVCQERSPNPTHARTADVIFN